MTERPHAPMAQIRADGRTVRGPYSTRADLRSFFPAVFLMLLTAVLTGIIGCDISGNPDTASYRGEALVRSGPYLFRIGGLDDAGSPSGRVLRAGLDSDGSAGAWTEMGPLPEPAAFAAVAAAGNNIYLIGGRTSAGPSAGVRIAGISAAGEYLFASRWVENPVSLPAPRESAAALVNDGRIFMLGGENAAGNFDTILHARIYQDGQVGRWYTSPRRLPSGLAGTAAAAAGGYLVVAGGRSGTAVSKDAAAYLIGTDGLLGEPADIDLIFPRERGVLVSDGSVVHLIGGYYANGISADSIALDLDTLASGNPVWTTSSVFPAAAAVGPASVKAYGRVFVLSGGGVGMSAVSPSVPVAPDLPAYFPGSGIVPASFRLRLNAEPGTEAFFGATAFTGSSLPASAGEETRTSTVTVRDSSGTREVFVPVAYRAGNFSGMTFDAQYVSWTSLVAGVELQIPLSAVWYEFESSGFAHVGFTCSAPDEPACSVSFFEADTLTYVIGIDGSVLYRVAVGTGQTVTAGPAEFGPGRYYILVETEETGGIVSVRAEVSDF